MSQLLRYVCIKPCYADDRLFKKGDPFSFVPAPGRVSPQMEKALARHFELIGGALKPAQTVIDDTEAAERLEEVTLEEIKRVLTSLDHANDDHWTATGMPKMSVIEKALNCRGITREQVTKAMPGYTRDVTALSQVKTSSVMPG